MAEGSAIQWTDNTHNEWIGCSKISPACDFCYAENYDYRHHESAHWGPGAPRKRTSEANRRKPYAWQREAERTGVSPWVFCLSLGDWADKEVPEEWRGDLWDTIADTPLLRWQLLTKRIGLAAKYLPAPEIVRRYWQHVGIMATVENQKIAERDIPKLIALKQTHGVRWVGLSCEPLLGELHLARYLPRIDWVITGGETDPQRKGRARITPRHHFRGVRDQCAAAGVPYFHKQNGDWLAWDMATDEQREQWHKREMRSCLPDGLFIAAGKAAAGRVLDGRTHSEMPRVFD